MLSVIVIVSVGMILGFILREKTKVFVINEKLVMYAIYLLLLFLGISVGSNEKIMSNLDMIGIKVITITVGAVTGSIIFSWILFNYMFRGKDEK
ncbi:MAG: DUF340 domain-containing protein [Candidatus Cloacimonadota bacterium]|nr:MAG: DUF340 domain-containing protein [Candidatus Cloacimonadota bacterium]PIE78543.1 MAG: DUF340 domain-containing protein [Candidatus Delongbacteria bacterium]